MILGYNNIFQLLWMLWKIHRRNLKLGVWMSYSVVLPAKSKHGILFPLNDRDPNDEILEGKKP